MSNVDIKKMAKRHSIYLWQIAAELGISDVTFSRRLRFELSEKDKREIISIIERLSTQLVEQEA